mgnify:CR=1 FL=1
MVRISVADGRGDLRCRWEGASPLQTGGGISVADRRGHLRCRWEEVSPLQTGGGTSVADGRGDLPSTSMEL